MNEADIDFGTQCKPTTSETRAQAARRQLGNHLLMFKPTLTDGPGAEKTLVSNLLLPSVDHWLYRNGWKINADNRSGLLHALGLVDRSTLQEIKKSFGDKHRRKQTSTASVGADEPRSPQTYGLADDDGMEGLDFRNFDSDQANQLILPMGHRLAMKALCSQLNIHPRQRNSTVDKQRPGVLKDGLLRIKAYAGSHADQALALELLEIYSTKFITPPAWTQVEMIKLFDIKQPMEVEAMKHALRSIVGLNDGGVKKLEACIDLAIQVASFQTDLLHRPSKSFWKAVWTKYSSEDRMLRKAGGNSLATPAPPRHMPMLKKFSHWYTKRLDIDTLSQLPCWPEPKQGGKHE